MIMTEAPMLTKIQVFSDNSQTSSNIRQILPGVSDFNITVEQVLQAQGSDPSKLLQRKPTLVAMTEKAIQVVLEKADPQLFFVNLPITKKDHKSVHLGDSIRMVGETIDRAIRPADSVIASIFTIGPNVEEHIALLFREDPAFALAMDTAASYFIDRMGSVLCQAVELFVQSTGEKTGIPISPGTIDWDVQTGQPQLFSFFSEFTLPIKLNSSGMMTPQKSMSMLVPFGKHMTETGKPCDFCSMSATCKFKEAV
jgi:hypothetical protein